MTNNFQLEELGAFLKARRSELGPADLGLPSTHRRRVQGLRREEVAQLAAISTDYYARIEQGRRHAPDDVLAAIARVLRLDPDQRQYAFELAHASIGQTHRAPGRERVPAGIRTLIDTMVSAAVIVQNGRLDIVDANTLGRALFADAFDSSVGRANLARFVFLDVRATSFYTQWDTIADLAVAILRVEAGRAPESKELSNLIGDLAARSDEFKTRWAAHEVRAHHRGIKRVRHPIVGALTLRYEALEIPDSGGLTMFAYTADPGTDAEDALKLLARSATGAPNSANRDAAGNTVSDESS